MAKSTADAPPPHEFPFWPFSCTAFYSYAMRDLGRYGQAATRATDGLQALRAEGDYGLALWQDLMQAYYDLAVLPLTLATTAAAGATRHPVPARNSKPIGGPQRRAYQPGESPRTPPSRAPVLAAAALQEGQP